MATSPAAPGLAEPEHGRIASEEASEEANMLSAADESVETDQGGGLIGTSWRCCCVYRDSPIPDAANNASTRLLRLSVKTHLAFDSRRDRILCIGKFHTHAECAAGGVDNLIDHLDSSIVYFAHEFI